MFKSIGVISFLAGLIMFIAGLLGIFGDILLDMTPWAFLIFGILFIIVSIALLLNLDEKENKPAYG